MEIRRKVFSSSQEKESTSNNKPTSDKAKAALIATGAGLGAGTLGAIGINEYNLRTRGKYIQDKANAYFDLSEKNAKADRALKKERKKALDLAERRLDRQEEVLRNKYSGTVLSKKLKTLHNKFNGKVGVINGKYIVGQGNLFPSIALQHRLNEEAKNSQANHIALSKKRLKYGVPAIALGTAGLAYLGKRAYDKKKAQKAEQKEFGIKSKLLGLVSPGAYFGKEAAKYGYEKDDPEYKKLRNGYALKGAVTPLTAYRIKKKAESMAAEGKTKDEIRDYLEGDNGKRLIGAAGDMAAQYGAASLTGGWSVPVIYTLGYGAAIYDKVKGKRAPGWKKSDSKLNNKKEQ